MRFTAHIGLGKTGTSAIQFALTSYDGNLGNKRKWPILLDGSSVDHKWLSDPHTSAKTKALYDAIVAHSEKTGRDHVVWSNEAISNNRPAVSLFKELSTWSPDLDVQVILYVREPSRWLKSAWEQWGLSHKRLKVKYLGHRPIRRTSGQSLFLDGFKNGEEIFIIAGSGGGASLTSDFIKKGRILLMTFVRLLN